MSSASWTITFHRVARPLIAAAILASLSGCYYGPAYYDPYYGPAYFDPYYGPYPYPYGYYGPSYYSYPGRYYGYPGFYSSSFAIGYHGGGCHH